MVYLLFMKGKRKRRSRTCNIVQRRLRFVNVLSFSSATIVICQSLPAAPFPIVKF